MARMKLIIIGLLLGMAVLAFGCTEDSIRFSQDGDVSDGDADGDEPIDGDWVPDGDTEYCTSHADCAIDEYCDPCATSSCPNCDDCLGLCVSHGCESEGQLSCAADRPACTGNYGQAVSIIEDGCWVCVDRATCGERYHRRAHCDDGTIPSCNSPTPNCENGEILALQNNCYACVDPDSCEPAQSTHCQSDADCGPADYCDDCAESSCPNCDDCISACRPHGCSTESRKTCDEPRFDCGQGAVSVLQDGCWVCVYSSSCQPTGHDPRCDDGTTPMCDMIEPECSEGEILAYQDDCYRCVNPATCKPWGQAGCAHAADCPASEYCDDCATSSCPMCDDCVAACVPHGCESETDGPICDMIRPDCDPGEASVIRDGCWVCVDMESCDSTGRDSHCDDGSEPMCNMLPPECNDGEILAYQDSCYVCVNPDTCVPWGEPTCTADIDCGPSFFCNDCATGSCPGCEDCVAGCTAHSCDTEFQLNCYLIRPDCGDSGVAVIKDGCWVCVDRSSCQPLEHDPRCDDGSTPMCDMVPPTCGEHEILANQDDCYRCVNPQTCLPWGESQCQSDADCPAQALCGECGSSSCPICADCVAACVVHGCETESQPACNMIRPDCEQGGVAVVRNGCWQCVGLNACQPIGRDMHCDDGSAVTCQTLVEVVCESYEVKAIQDGCYVCVNGETCLPWGQSECQSTSMCADDDYCNTCATSSCPNCDDCIGACVAHDCATGEEALCDMIRPDCEWDEVSIVSGDCWQCVDRDTCLPMSL